MGSRGTESLLLYGLVAILIVGLAVAAGVVLPQIAAEIRNSLP